MKEKWDLQISKIKNTTYFFNMNWLLSKYLRMTTLKGRMQYGGICGIHFINSTEIRKGDKRYSLENLSKNQQFFSTMIFFLIGHCMASCGPALPVIYTAINLGNYAIKKTEKMKEEREKEEKRLAKLRLFE